jgi:hypothetical protein
LIPAETTCHSDESPAALRAKAAAMGLRHVLPVQTNSRVFMREKKEISDGVASRSPVNADVDEGASRLDQ